MLRYIYDRSKNNQGNLILWAGSRAEDTFMYHNNKDNSIKTPIIARYNTLRWDTDREEGIFFCLFIIIWAAVSDIRCRSRDLWDLKHSRVYSLDYLRYIGGEIFTGPQTVCPRFISASKYPPDRGWGCETNLAVGGNLFVGPRPGGSGLEAR